MGRLFGDMDGSFAEWKPVTAFEDLYEEGYFRTLKAHDALVLAFRAVITSEGVEGFINSHYLQDSKYALKEKNSWVDEQLPEIPRHNRIFSSCGINKTKYVPGGIKPNDILIDDYTPNLREWEAAGGTGIKFMNGINGTKGTWNGLRIDKNDSPEKIAKLIIKTLREKDALVHQKEDFDR